MADDDHLDPVEIELDAEKAPQPPEKPANAAESAQEPPARPPEEDPQLAIEQLKAQVEAQKRAALQERAAREEAERRAQEQEARATSATAEAVDGRLTAIQNAIRAVETEASGAEKAMADALAAGDHATAAKAQRYIAQMEARLLQLENGRAAIEDQIEYAKVNQQKPPRQEPIPQRQPADDPLEAWANTLSGPSQQWVRAHKSVFSDPQMARRIGAAHNAAVDLEGIAPDTPEYFAFIEEKIGLRNGRDAGTKSERGEPPAPKPAKSPPVPAAPVGGASSGGAARGNTMTLSAEMREIARSLYPDLPAAEAEKQYAMDRAAMIREGKISA